MICLDLFFGVLFSNQILFIQEINPMIVKQEQHAHFATLQEQLKSLIKARKEIVDKMSTLTKRRFFLQATPKNKPENQQALQLQGQGRKIVKLDSKESLDNGHDSQTHLKDHRIRSTNSLGSQEQQNETVKKMKEEAAQRNRRMFQGLNTYLDKAKSKLQQQKPKREQTNKIHEKIQERERQKSQRLLKQELDKINAEYAQHQKLKNQNSKQILKIQNLILLKSYTQYANAIRPFIFTKTQPSISWKPTKDIPKDVPKDMEKLFKKLFNQRQQEIEQKNKKIIHSIQTYQNKFEYSLYLYQNQQQYYQNLLKNHYLLTQNFIQTKTEPPIMWKPAQHLKKEKEEELRQASVKMVEVMLEKNRKECQDYYREKLQVYKQRKEKGHHDQHDGDSRSQSPHKQEQD